VQIAIDDATRIPYVEVLDDERAATAVGFLRRAVAHYRSYGIAVERVMTDDGNAYRSTIHALACKALRLTPPYPAPPAAHQRQGRTPHPHPPRRLGIRHHLPQQR